MKSIAELESEQRPRPAKSYAEADLTDDMSIGAAIRALEEAELRDMLKTDVGDEDTHIILDENDKPKRVKLPMGWRCTL